MGSNIKRVAVLPIIGPDLVYGRTGREAFVKGFMTIYDNMGFKSEGKGNRLILPDYVEKPALFGDIMSEVSDLMKHGYRLKMSFGGLCADPVMMDRCVGSMILVMPMVSKGPMLHERVYEKFQTRFEGLNFTHITGVDYNVYRKEGRVFLNPVQHDRISQKVFMLNLLIAIRRGYRVHAVPV